MSFFERLQTFVRAHRYAVTWAAIGLVFMILVFTINFWRTLLLCVIVGVSALFGSLMDKGGVDAVRAFLDQILPRR